MPFSFVVQGPVISETTENGFATREVLLSIRKYFPDSEIVLSTWEGSNVEGLEFDKVVFSEDPGAIVLKYFTFNAKRLIVSTVSGIQNCTHDFVVKTRTDIALNSNVVLEKFLANAKKIRSSSYKLFDKTVVSTNFYVRNPVRLNYGFHCSDIFLVGQKSDLLALFEHDFSNIENEAIGIAMDQGKPERYLRIVPEQYLLSRLLYKKHGVKVVFDGDGRYLGVPDFCLSERLLFTNFKFFHPTQLGVVLPTRFYERAYPGTNYSPLEIKTFDTLFKIPVVRDVFSKVRGGVYYLNYWTVKATVANLFKHTMVKLKWKS